LTELLGQQVFVENRPGAGGLIGTRAFLGEQPDGHTIFAALASIYMILPAQQPNLPFDVNKDMMPIGLTAFEGLVMACSPKLGVKTLAEFIALAKKQPDKLVIGTNPTGSLPHLTAKLFVDQQKPLSRSCHIPLAALPMRSATFWADGFSPSSTDGRASGAVSSRTTLPLAIMSPKPTASLPNLPVAGETIPGVTSIGWQALTVRQGTPEPIVRLLENGLRKARENPQLQTRLQETGPEFHPLYGAELTKFIQDEQKFWLPLAKKYAT
jgi:tripartite-type tricarboxylate transporter receptor subunit TctC